MRTAPALLLDLVCVVVFVSVGRSSHGEADSIGGLASTLWPFLGGLVLGWLLVLRTRRPVGAWQAGGLVWLGILVGAVVLRAVSGQGLAVSFVAVIAGFFALMLLGWRFVATRMLGRVRG